MPHLLAPVSYSVAGTQAPQAPSEAAAAPPPPAQGLPEALWREAVSCWGGPQVSRPLPCHPSRPPSWRTAVLRCCQQGLHLPGHPPAGLCCACATRWHATPPRTSPQISTGSRPCST